MSKKDECDCEFPQTLEEGSHLGLMNALANCPHIGKPESHKQELEDLFGFGEFDFILINDRNGKPGSQKVIYRRDIEALIETYTANKVVEELEYIKSQNVAIPCEPDCDELRHARHQGAWEQHLEFDNDIDTRIAHLKGQQDTSKGELGSIKEVIDRYAHSAYQAGLSGRNFDMGGTRLDKVVRSIKQWGLRRVAPDSSSAELALNERLASPISKPTQNNNSKER